MTYRRCLGFDFDGVIHSYEKGWDDRTVYGTIDITGIKKAHNLGLAVAIITCRDIRQVMNVLTDNSLSCIPDWRCERGFWSGGPDGTEVLVTNRKVFCVAYIDDRAVRHVYGDDWDRTLEGIA